MNEQEIHPITFLLKKKETITLNSGDVQTTLILKTQTPEDVDRLSILDGRTELRVVLLEGDKPL